MISLRRKIVFSLIPALLLLALLAFTEAGLRLFSPSLALPLVTTASYDGIEWLQINRGYLEKYFPANVVLLPELKPSLMRPQKTRNIFRVFCLGGSSMFGTPYQMTATIPAILRKQLRHVVTGKEIEVINLGASAINTNVIVDMSKQLVGLKPDVVLLYAGHNEFYGPDGVGASFLEKRLPFLTPLKYRLRDLRLVRLFQRVLAQTLQRKTPDEERNMMKLVSQEIRVPLYSDDAERIFTLFEKNLREIVETFSKAGIPVIVSDVSSNRLFPPFAYDPHEEFTEIGADYEHGHFQKVIQDLQPILIADPTNAYATYWTGRAYLALDEPDSGWFFLRQARNFDLLKFRAPDRTNDIIAKTCRELDVPFVSSDSLFVSADLSSVPGGQLFWEHLHPTAYGYYLIADLFLRKLADLNLLPVAKAKGSTLPRLPFDKDSLNLCWLDLAIAELSIQHLTSQWPFNNYRAKMAVIDSADQELMRVATAVYNRTMNWDEGCYKTALHFQRTGRYRDAATTLGSLIDDYPYNSYAYYLLGNINKEVGNTEEAVRNYRRCIEIKPDYSYARVELGLIEINAGHFDDAISQLTAALRLTEGKNLPAVQASIYYGLSAAFANKGDFSKAMQYVEQSLRIVPSYEAAQQLRKSLQSRQ